MVLTVLLAWLPSSFSAVNSWQPETLSDSDQAVELEDINYSPSADTQSGYLDALTIEQSAADAEPASYLQVRTDRVHYPQCSLDLEVASDWKGKQIEVTVDNLKRLYALNGTFDDGVPGVNLNPNGGVSFHPLGWDAYSDDSTFYQHQRASYINQSSSYLSVENEGREYTDEQFLEQYRHYSGTYVLWSQQISSVPSTEDLLFSMSYLYDSGPLGSRFDNNFLLRVVLTDGFTDWPIWEIDPAILAERDVWYNVNSIPVSFSGLPSTLEIQVSLTIQDQMYIDWDDSNCDGDPGNAKFIRSFFDNVSLVTATPPEFNAVGLQASVQPVGATPFIGSAGTGRALLNHSYWESSPITVILSSSLPVSFNYEARFSHVVRWLNSSRTRALTDYGVSYAVDFGRSPRLTLYTHNEYHGDYSSFIVGLNHPRDWKNTTVLDPFSVDVTALCNITQDSIEIQGSTLDSLGWWSVSFDAPNYVMNLSPQWFNNTSTTWQDEMVFNCGNDIRASLTIGTLDSTPATVDGIDVSWNLPNETIWSSEQLSGSGGVDIFSGGQILGAYNTTPGTWKLVILWTNGSEVAYDKVDFEVHHSMVLVSVFTSIQAEMGTNSTGAVRLIDEDNGNPLLGGMAAVMGNWSGASVQFRPNSAKGWWEADFNTTLMGTGNFTVVVNASRSYYEDATCSFEIQIITDTVMEFMDTEYVEIGLGGVYTAIFRYQYLDGTGITDASVQVMTWTGPGGGLSSNATTQVPGQPGNYSIDFSATLSGTYHIPVSGSKVNHKTATTSFYLVVGEIETQLLLLNGSAATINAESNYTVVIQYLNGTGEGLIGATVDVINIAPESGLNFSVSSYHGNGTYSILLHPENHGTFSLIIGASLVNHESQFTSFTITVSQLASILSLETSADHIASDRNYTIILTFQDEGLVGLENASITVVSMIPSIGLDFSNVTDLGGGNYSITLIPIVGDDYEIVFRASLPRYQNATGVFTLHVTDAETTLRTSDGLDTGNAYYNETLEITLLFERADFPTNISLATIEVEYAEGLSYTVSEQFERYVLQVTSTVSGTHFLTIIASRTGYQSSVIVFKLIVDETPTSVIGTGPPAIMYSGVLHSFTLWYNMSDITGIDGAIVNITYTPFGITWSEMGNGYYEFNFTSGDPGDYSISIRLSKYGFQKVDRAYTFEVRRVPTTVHCIGRPVVFYLTCTYNMSFFLNSSILNGVEGADITPSLQIDPFFSLQAQGQGWYNFTLTPTILGDRNATFSFEKSGFESQVFSFMMTVDLIPIAIAPRYTLNQTYSMSEYRKMDMELKFIANNTGEVIKDAVVEYYIIDSTTQQPFGSSHRFIGTDGLYRTSIEMPPAGLYILNITISKENHKTLSMTILLDIEPDLTAFMFNYVWSFLPLGMSMIALVTGTAFGRRAYMRRTTRRKLELLAYESRFEDAKNIVGFFVIHRNSGLPIYSKVLKGGLEEALVSGFISAVSLFRSELGEEARLWTAIPISEIITAVQTEVMICAIITTSSRSSRQAESLEAAGRAIGALFDQDTETLTRITMNPETAGAFESTFDQIFGEYLDGYFVDMYVGIKELPTREYRPLERAMAEMDTSKEVKPSDLVKTMVLAGTNELKAYHLVVDAIEAGLLISSETDYPFSPEIHGIPEEGGDDVPLDDAEES